MTSEWYLAWMLVLCLCQTAAFGIFWLLWEKSQVFHGRSVKQVFSRLLSKNLSQIYGWSCRLILWTLLMLFLCFTGILFHSSTQISKRSADNVMSRLQWKFFQKVVLLKKKKKHLFVSSICRLLVFLEFISYWFRKKTGMGSYNLP